jgi:hypothetical protein
MPPSDLEWKMHVGNRVMVNGKGGGECFGGACGAVERSTRTIHPTHNHVGVQRATDDMHKRPVWLAAAQHGRLGTEYRTQTITM